MLTHPDRLTRFGFHTLQTLLATFGTEVEAVNDNAYRTPHEELVEDLLTIVAHFSGKLYGTRSHKQKKAVERVKNLLTET